ncbi:J-domain-containing protein [Tengunoibacter tsumagoiensis]|uniref:DnaJ homologue subfamily C member 28 conserved domain-containing protein n=1 Tax=Tengunoibacter tsumagoiensis TaxID=2014871 RepID=A0A401ZZL8_9CHLR|nr:DUF1992 domain-containing protein [Tengunoibacter tsumagoiensis]GCE12305.1 hypothetical protein KTT_21640 [Tengunoibacter tsumagoiensis]
MDFVDWRQKRQQAEQNAEPIPRTVPRRGQLVDYIEEMIREAQARGEFTNLPGEGKPLELDAHPEAGENEMAYRFLKRNGYAPPELELCKEIKRDRERAEKKIARLLHQSRTLHNRRLTPLGHERRNFNGAVERAAAEYQKDLHEINRKILTANLTLPTVMHQPMLDIEALVQKFREACPLFQP